MASQAYVINARIAAGLSTLLCWMCVVSLAAVVVTHQPSNHIALDIRVCYVLGGLAIAAAQLGRGALATPLVWGTLASGVILILFVFVLDQWNLVVGYEVWLERGQPFFGQR